VEEVGARVVKLEKEVKEKTVLISNLRNEMSKLDFALSSDSEKEEQRFNPAYTRLNDRINDLKQKVIQQLGTSCLHFLTYAKENALKAERSKVAEIVGEENVGVWQIAENITKLERVLIKIPMYV
jgi:hypothetical protein